MKLKDVLRYCFVSKTPAIAGYLEKEITFITQDSRKVVPGTLFIAIKGKRCDGHELLEEVLELGAEAVVVEKNPVNPQVPYLLVKDTTKALAQIANAFYDLPSEKLKVVGVTGTNGKTTITHLLDQIARLLGDKTGIIGTIHNKVNHQIYPTVNTTPDSLTIQRLFHEMVMENVTVCAMEVSSHGLALGRSWGIDFDVAIFTNFTQDHLDFHDTMANYFLAKTLLFSQLGNSYGGKQKLVVINCDDPYGEKLYQYTAMTVLTYGCRGRGDIQGTNIHVTDSGTDFTLWYKDTLYQVETKLIGQFNVYNILATVGACLALGYSIVDVIGLIPLLKPIRGRFELVSNRKEVVGIVDYAHTPDSLENVLKTAQQLTRQRLYCVVGCGGDRDKSKRPLMANIALKHATTAIFTADNARSEDPMAIIAEMVAGSDQENYRIEPDRTKAIHQAMTLATKGDIVLVAGKGHETYQIVGEETIHFDDREVISNF